MPLCAKNTSNSRQRSHWVGFLFIFLLLNNLAQRWLFQIPSKLYRRHFLCRWIIGCSPSYVLTLSSGIVLTAASGALFIYYHGHGSTILQDGRRLVLALFLFFAALWAQIDFVNLLIAPGSLTTCQVTLVFSTVSDQLARVALEQFLLWSVGVSAKATFELMILQGVLAIRLVAGGMLVGFTRPEFAPACLARTSLMPVSIVVLALDLVIIGGLILRSLRKSHPTHSRMAGAHGDHKKALMFTVMGFVLWTGVSKISCL